MSDKSLSGSRAPASRLAAFSSVAAQTQCDSLVERDLSDTT
jgi:hypothetical protein